MGFIWHFFDKKNWTLRGKYAGCSLASVILWGTAGFLIWQLIRLFALNTPVWMLIFTGWPALCGWFAVFLYGCRHDLHEGKYDSTGILANDSLHLQ